MLKDENSVSIRQFKELEKRVKVLEKILSSNERKSIRKHSKAKEFCDLYDDINLCVCIQTGGNCVGCIHESKQND